MESRAKTKSKNYFDDEIREVLNNGDIYLKTGVRRTPKYSFNTESDEYEAAYINYWVSQRDMSEKRQSINEEENNWD